MLSTIRRKKDHPECGQDLDRSWFGSEVGSSAPPFPTSDWTAALDGLESVVALAALFEGDLLLFQADGSVLRGEAEAPSICSMPTELPSVPDATSAGTCLYSQFEFDYVASSSQGLDHGLDVPEGSAWLAISSPQSGMCIAASRRREILFSLSMRMEASRHYTRTLPWVRDSLALCFRGLRTMAGWNTKLFAIGTDNRYTVARRLQST